MPVMALPKINEWISDWPSMKNQQSPETLGWPSLTISLRYKEVGNMPSNAILVTDCIAAKYFL